MTNLQVMNKQANETERHNRVMEALESGKLSETISNNLRRYHVDMTAQQIQKIANDQLNKREIAKNAETMRNNLARELETNRHNLKEEETNRLRQTVSMLSSIISKPESAALFAAMSYLVPDVTLNALGINAPKPAEIKSWQTGQQSSTPTPVYENDNKIVTGTRSGQYPVAHPSNASKVSGHSRSHVVEDEDEDEIPEDFSNSKGPSNASANNYKQSRSNNSSHETVSTSSNHSYNTKGSYETRTPEGTRVIYSPGTHYGPGFV